MEQKTLTVMTLSDPCSASPNVPKEYLMTRGAVLLLSVFDYDRLKWDDFAGEVAVHLANVSPLSSMDRSVDRMPVIMMPLKRPVHHRQGPFSVSALGEWPMSLGSLTVCVGVCVCGGEGCVWGGGCSVCRPCPPWTAAWTACPSS